MQNSLTRALYIVDRDVSINSRVVDDFLIDLTAGC